MKRILIIEDDLNSRHMIRVVLEQAGYETSTAGNGKEGLRIAQTLLPDLILSDIMMDVMDGYSFLEVLREKEATATIPVILMTGLSTRDSMRKSMNLGADDYLTKPIAVPDLLQAIETRLSKQLVFKQEVDRKLQSIKKSLNQNLPHEINTPLSTLVGVSHLLRTEGLDLPGEEVAEMASWIHEAALRLQHLFENFLFLHHLDTLSHAEHAALKQTLPLALLLPIEEYSYQIARKHDREADLVLQISPVSIQMDEQYFKKLFSELLENAFKFSKPNDAVTVTAGSTPEGPQLSISDLGYGMSAEQVDAVDTFQQFERDHYEQQGLGLGLALAKRIMFLHQGMLSLTSTPLQGTTITLHFPKTF